MTKAVNKSKIQNSVNNFISSYFQEVQQTIMAIDKLAIERIIEAVLEGYKRGSTIYLLGNGGSASIASHIACDLGKGTLSRVYDKHEKRLHVLSLTDNVATITAYANDLSFDAIYFQQLRNLVEKDDIVIAISGSGNSKNIIKAISYAKKIGAKTIGLTGFTTGGKLAKLVDIPLVLRSNHYGPIEDVHLMVGHLLASYIANIKDKEYKGNRVKKNTAVPFKA